MESEKENGNGIAEKKKLSFSGKLEQIENFKNGKAEGEWKSIMKMENY